MDPAIARLLWIGVGGGLGAMIRAVVSVWLNPGTSARIPWGTLAVNVMGSLLLGVLVGLADRGLPEPWRAAATTGLLGGLTTFSTFSVETVRLAQAGSWRLAAINLALQIGLGLGAAAVGLTLVRS